MTDGKTTPAQPAAESKDPALVQATTAADIAAAKARTSEAELKNKQNELAIERAGLEADLALAKARGEALKGILPEPTTKALEGEVSVYGDEAKLGYATELVAYRMLGELEVAVANRVCADGVLVVEEPAEGHDDGSRHAPVVLVIGGDPETYAYGDVALLEIKAQLNAYETALNERSDTNEGLLSAYQGGGVGEEDGRLRAAFADPATLALFLGAAPRIAGAVASVASYFQADYKVKERTFNVDRLGLVAAVAGRLSARGVDVRLPGLLQVEDSPLLAQLSGLQGMAVKLRANKNSLSSLITGSLGKEVARLEKRLGEAKKDGGTAGQTTGGQPNAGGQPASAAADVVHATAADAGERGAGGADGGLTKEEKVILERKLAETQRSLDDAQAAVASTETLLTAFDSFCAAITAAEEGQKASKLAQAVVLEKLHASGVSHILWLDVLSSGGEAVTKRTKWWWSSGKISLMGGAAIAFFLVTTAGKVVAADTLTRMGVLERPLFGGEAGTETSI